MKKMMRYAPSSFADLVFADKRIEAGLKRGKFDHLALMNEKTGANEEDENEEGTHVVTAIPIRPSFPPTQQCHYLANNNPSPYLPPSYPYKSYLNQPQNPPTTPPTRTPPLAQTKTSTRNEFCSEKACRIHPNSGVLC